MLLDALKLANTIDLDRRPGHMLMSLGAVVLAAVVTSKLAPLFGVGAGDLDTIEFVASLAAGILTLVIGAALHVSADRLQGEGTKALSNAAIGFASMFDQAPSTSERDLEGARR
jgi:hypothetical protein